MRETDLAAAMRLKTEAGWNQVEADWRFFLEQRPEGCFVAVAWAQDTAWAQDAVVGTVTTIAYGPRLAWIGMMLVDAAVRRRGIGTRLMQAALDSLAGQTTIALDATPAGRPVYERLGFRAEYELVRLIRPDGFGGQRPDRRGRGVRGKTGPVSSDALAQIAALDRAAFGADRAALLRSLCARAPEAARLTRGPGPAAGFCLGRHGSRLSQLGPVAAETLEQAAEVCRAALAAWAGRAVVIDVPASQAPFVAWLRGEGFEVQRPFTRMTCGEPLPRAADPVHTFAICGPEFG